MTMTKMMIVAVQVAEAVVAAVMTTMKMMIVAVQVAEVVAVAVMMTMTTMIAVVVQMAVDKTLVIKNAMLMDALRLKQPVFENKGGIRPPLFFIIFKLMNE